MLIVGSEAIIVKSFWERPLLIKAFVLLVSPPVPYLFISGRLFDAK